ncbi:MAG: universal stress protein [Thermoplasmata archaeon]
MFRVLIPIDFSPDSKSFVEEGFKILPNVDEVSFLYVIPLGMKELEDFVDKDGIEYAKRKAEVKMKEFIRNLNIKASKITSAVVEGDPSRIIIDLANSGNFETVLIGHRGYAYVEEFFIGSVTLKVISKVSIPVIIVKKAKGKEEDILEMK